MSKIFSQLPSVPVEKLPRHVALIMDGNGRWASRQGLPRLKGHAAGIETIRKVIEELSELGIPVVTFYTFSTENWGRPLEEVSGIFDLMRWWFKRELAETIKKGVRIRLSATGRMGDWRRIFCG